MDIEKKNAFVGATFVENGNFDRSWRDEKFGDAGLATTAQDMTNDEKAMSIREALSIYRKAVLWCLLIVRSSIVRFCSRHMLTDLS